MAEQMPKLNVGPVLMFPLAFSIQAGNALAKFSVEEKLKAAKESSVAQKVLTQKGLFLVIAGVFLIFYGNHFTNLLLCVQLVSALCYDRVKNSVAALYNDAVAARDNLKKDDAPKAEDAKVDDSANKHAKKRDDKKKVDAASAAAAEAREKDAAAAMKVLKTLSSEKLTNAAFEVFASIMACVLVLRGGLPRSLLVGHLLVTMLAPKVTDFLEFEGFEAELQAWTDLFVRAFLYFVCLGLAVFVQPLGLAVYAAAFGLRLLAEEGPAVAKVAGKDEVVSALVASKNGLFAAVGLLSVGTLWQMWSWAAGSSLPWYIQLPLLPAVLAEGVLSFV